jgi:hypothetical protein
MLHTWIAFTLEYSLPLSLPGGLSPQSSKCIHVPLLLLLLILAFIILGRDSTNKEKHTIFVLLNLAYLAQHNDLFHPVFSNDIIHLFFLNWVLLCVCVFVYLLVFVHLTCFSSLTFVKRAVINMGCKCLFYITLTLSDIYSWVVWWVIR